MLKWYNRARRTRRHYARELSVFCRQAMISKQRTATWSEHLHLLQKACDFFAQSSHLEVIFLRVKTCTARASSLRWQFSPLFPTCMDISYCALQNHKQFKSLVEQAEGEVDAFERRFKLYKAEQLQQMQVCLWRVKFVPLNHCLTTMALTFDQSDDPSIFESQDRKSGLRGVDLLKSHWDSLKMRLFMWQQVCTQVSY